MAELFEEVVVLLESRSSTRALARRFRIESQQAAGNGAVLCIPLFVSELHRWAADPAKAASLLKTLRSIDTSGLDDPGATVEGNAYDPTGTNLTNKLFGDRRHSVATAIAAEAGISVQSADHLLAPTGWAFVACLVDRYGNRMDRHSLVKILNRELDELLEADWGPWMDTVGQESDAGRGGGGFLGRSRSSQLQEPPDDYDVYDEHDPYGQIDPYGQSDPYGVGGYDPPGFDGPGSADPSRYGRPSHLGGASLLGGMTGIGDDQDRYGEPGDYEEMPGPFGFGGAAAAGAPDSNRRSLAAARDDVSEDAGPSKIPLILAAVAVGLLGLLGLSQLLGGDGNDDVTAAIGVDGNGQEPAQVDAFDSDAAPLAEPVAMMLNLVDPLSSSAATGQLQLRINPQAGEVCYTVSADAMAAPYDGHIHAGAVGQSGEVVVGLGLLNNGDIGCAAVAPTTLTQLITNRASYYVDLHDAANVTSIRAQLSDGVEGQAADSEVIEQAAVVAYDPTGSGASLRLESGRLVLVGEVADQQTLDGVVSEYVELAGQDLEVLSELVVVEGAPLPSGRIVISNGGLFQVGSDQLAADRGTVIDDLALLLQNRPDWTATVVGHTDSTGSEGLNLDLSLRRATAVMNELVANGVSAGRLTSDGAGSSQPIADNSTTDSQAQNRRIELIVVRG